MSLYNLEYLNKNTDHVTGTLLLSQYHYKYYSTIYANNERFLSKNTRQFLQNNLFYSFSVAKYTDNIIMPAKKNQQKPGKTYEDVYDVFHL